MKDSFTDYFEELIGPEEAEQFFCALRSKETLRGLRANTLKITKGKLHDWLVLQGYEVENCDFSTDCLLLSGRGEKLALKLPYHAGFTYPQDPSSMFAVEYLDPQPGEMVLDLTAAPGGKTTHIAQKMENRGLLIANDMDTRRLKSLHFNLERLGVWNTLVTRATPYRLSQHFGEVFDRVLLDPSCSGEGLLVTHGGKPNFWNRKALKRYAAEQFGLLCSAFALLKPGGRLVYSTCTLNDVEDDGVVEKLLKKFPEAELVNVKLAEDDLLSVKAPKQVNRSDGSALKGVRFWPQKSGTKGFFCVAISKSSSIDNGSQPGGQLNGKPGSMRRLNKERRRRFDQFIRERFACDLPEGVDLVTPIKASEKQVVHLMSKGSREYPLPQSFSFSFPFFELGKGGPDGSEIRLTHAGAIWLGLHATKGVVDLNREETINIFEQKPMENSRTDENGEKLNGFFLIKHEDFPLGQAKFTEKSIEPKLPRQF
jgi:NOL1/NOP2/sun family putative RNA methylase